MTIKFRFVCASRVSRQEFIANTALGRSLSLFRSPFVELTLFDNNRVGLPVLYNSALRAASADPAVLIFVHDDIYICDFFWHIHLMRGLKLFDIIGLAGNRRRLPGQPAWCLVDDALNWDSSGNLSGIVAHGNGFPPAGVNEYGPTGHEVKLLDGVFLAARSEILLSRNIQFDEAFDFHFYDMDFCRHAEARQLRMGTWTISVIHESSGHFGSQPWCQGYQKYLRKWKS